LTYNPSSSAQGRSQGQRGRACRGFNAPRDNNKKVDGPIARRLKEYGRVKAFVVGPWAEMSSDLHALINCISERAAEVRWRGIKSVEGPH